MTRYGVVKSGDSQDQRERFRLMFAYLDFEGLTAPNLCYIQLFVGLPYPALSLGVSLL